jgi:hypothetical protein
MQLLMQPHLRVGTKLLQNNTAEKDLAWMIVKSITTAVVYG